MTNTYKPGVFGSGDIEEFTRMAKSIETSVIVNGDTHPITSDKLDTLLTALADYGQPLVEAAKKSAIFDVPDNVYVNSIQATIDPIELNSLPHKLLVGPSIIRYVLTHIKARTTPKNAAAYKRFLLVYTDYIDYLEIPGRNQSFFYTHIRPGEG